MFVESESVNVIDWKTKMAQRAINTINTMLQLTMLVELCSFSWQSDPCGLLTGSWRGCWLGMKWFTKSLRSKEQTVSFWWLKCIGLTIETFRTSGEFTSFQRWHLSFRLYAFHLFTAHLAILTIFRTTWKKIANSQYVSGNIITVRDLHPYASLTSLAKLSPGSWRGSDRYCLIDIIAKLQFHLRFI